MKRKFGSIFTGALLLCSLGPLPAVAFTGSHTASQKPTQITGCLEQGPVAKEYLLRTSDGTTWGVNETDMLMNNYLDHNVTITGEVMRPTASQRSAGGAKHYLHARDLVVDSDKCQK